MSKPDRRSDESTQREAHLVSGLSTAAASLLAASVANTLAEPILSIPEHIFNSKLRAGRIDAPHGTPLERLSAFTKAEAETIAGFAKKHGVSAPIIAAGPDAPFSYIQPKTGGGIDHIGLARKSVPTAMHEIGHGSPILKSKGLRDLSLKVHAMSGGNIGNVIRGLLLANTVRGRQEDGSGLLQEAYDYAPAITGATFAPMLLEEARATAHAVKGGSSIGKGLETLKDLAPGYGTYASRALGSVFMAMVAKKVVDHFRQENSEDTDIQKESSVRTPNILRVGASSAWRMQPSSAKPKTTSPTSSLTSGGKEVQKLKPPSNRAYHKDTMESLHNPSRGFRITKGG